MTIADILFILPPLTGVRILWHNVYAPFKKEGHIALHVSVGLYVGIS